MPDVVMPRLSDSMEEGTILKWLKADGDEVARGEELVEIETDKATMTYEADAAGTLGIVAQEGETLPIGATIATIGDVPARTAQQQPGDDEDAADTSESDEDQAVAADQADAPEADAAASDEEAESAETQPAATAEGQPAQSAEEAPTPQRASTATEAPPAEPSAPAVGQNGASASEQDIERAKASPVARRIARERGVDIATLQGTGPGGRVVKADVEAAAGPETEAPGVQAATSAPTAQPVAAASPADSSTAKGETQIQELSRIQQLIARRMAEAKATVPEFRISLDVDMEACVELRSQLKDAASSTGAGAPSYNDMVVKASALALREVPRVNGSYKDGHFELYSRVNVGFAVAGEDTLIAPTVFDADGKSLGEIARETRALAEKVRSGQIQPPDVSGGTFTVSNIGIFGVTSFTAIINSPQAAILAVGRMEPRAVVRDGEIVARNTLTLTLTCDHRILYGADAAEFLSRIRELLEAPIALAL